MSLEDLELLGALMVFRLVEAEEDPARLAKLKRYKQLALEGKAETREARRLWRELYGPRMESASPHAGAYAVEGVEIDVGDH